MRVVGLCKFVDIRREDEAVVLESSIPADDILAERRFHIAHIDRYSTPMAERHPRKGDDDDGKV